MSDAWKIRCVALIAAIALETARARSYTAKDPEEVIKDAHFFAEYLRIGEVCR